MDIKALAQVIDTEILDLHYEMAGLIQKGEMLGRKTSYDDTAWDELNVVNTQRLQASQRSQMLENVYELYGWTRAYIVPGGHVHKDYHCHTLFFDTERYLVAEVSGMTEDEIVAKAGERACTVCYPSAPSQYLALKSELFTRDEKEKENARREREAKHAAKEAAKVVVEFPEINARTKKPYIRTETFGSLRSAQNEVLSMLGRMFYCKNSEGPYGEEGAQKYLEKANRVIKAMVAHPQEERPESAIYLECVTKAKKKYDSGK